MKDLKRITIKGDLAHFKIPGYSKIQRTYDIPNPSTVVGILKNIYGDINDFIFGYTINYELKCKDLGVIYKEFNMLAKTYTDKERFKKDIYITEYLYNVELSIYTDIDKDILLDEPLVLGKANCLASLKIENVKLEAKAGIGHNQYTDINIGKGMIRKVNTITKYNQYKDMFDFQMALVRENVKFEYDRNYDKEKDENIFLWRWKDGVINEIS